MPRSTILALVGCVFALALAGTATAAPLSLGSRGPDVRALNERLAELSYLPAGAVYRPLHRRDLPCGRRLPEAAIPPAHRNRRLEGAAGARVRVRPTAEDVRRGQAYRGVAHQAARVSGSRRPGGPHHRHLVGPAGLRDPARSVLRLPQGAHVLVGAILRMASLGLLLHRRHRVSRLPGRPGVSGEPRLRSRATGVRARPLHLRDPGHAGHRQVVGTARAGGGDGDANPSPARAPPCAACHPDRLWSCSKRAASRTAGHEEAAVRAPSACDTLERFGTHSDGTRDVDRGHSPSDDVDRRSGSDHGANGERGLSSGRLGAGQRLTVTVSAEEHVAVAVVGAGQAGLATSHELTRAGVDHVVLERARVGETWRGRWDSFCLVTPNWTIRLPGGQYDGSDPDGFMPRDEIVAYLERYAASFQAPVREGVEVTAMQGLSARRLRSRDIGRRPARRRGGPGHGRLSARAPSGRRGDPAARPAADRRRRTTATSRRCRPGACSSSAAASRAARSRRSCTRPVATWFSPAGRRPGRRAASAIATSSGGQSSPASSMPPLAVPSEPGCATRREPPGDRHAAAATTSTCGRSGGGRHARRPLPRRERRPGALRRRPRRDRRLGRRATHRVHGPPSQDRGRAWPRSTAHRGARAVRSTRPRGDRPGGASAPSSSPAASAPTTARGCRGRRPSTSSASRSSEDGASTVIPGLHFVGVHFLRKRKSSLLVGVGEDAAIVAEHVAESLERG